MSTLVLLIPPRARSQAASARVGGATGDEFRFVLTSDGNTITQVGKSAPALLPKAESIVAVIDDRDVSWQRVVLPKAPAAKLRAALVGMMEEQLLDDPEAVHLALEPTHTAGEETWVCVVDKAWLKQTLDGLQQSGVDVERLVPMSWPEDTPLGHFSEDSSPGAQADSRPIQLTWSDIHGVTCLPLQGSLAKSLLSRWADAPARWSAHPHVAEQAERWLGARVMVLQDEQRALQAMRSLWNLRQFDLAPSHRGALALRQAWRSFLSPSWRPVRWGLAVFTALNVLGLNLWAWQLRGQLQDKREALVQVLRDAHPQVKAVQDAPIQMQRETDALRAASGRLADTDLESLLGALAAAWPDGRSPLETIRFEAGKFSTSSTGWSEQQVAQLRSALRVSGWQVEQQAGTLTLTRARLAPS